MPLTSPLGLSGILASTMDASVRFNLTWLDYSVIAFPVVLAFAVTLYMRRYTRSVSDYLAAGRSAGRYLISTAQMEMGITAGGVVTAMEVFSQTGFSMGLWGGFIGFFYFLLAMSGLITYRFRETRALTFHQFFEVRYSKGVRVFATFINVVSSLLTIGIALPVAARFFVYFLGLPLVVPVGSFAIPTYVLLMIFTMMLALYFAFSGGQLTIMTTDCLEGVISSFLYLVVAFTILVLFSYDQMGTALSMGKPGESYLDPFDIGKRPNFDYIYLLLSWAMTVYYWRGNAWGAAFAASAKTAHESQMAVVLGIWRGMAAGAMGGLIGLGAFTLIHSPDFAGHADAVRVYLETTIPLQDIQLRTQLLLPTALGVLLPAGVKGSLCAVLFMGMIAGSAAGLQNFSNGFIQDLILPYYKKRLEPARHILILRLTTVCVTIYMVIFGIFFKFTDYLVFVTQLMSAIYLAGIGAVVWGGLYWRRGTTQGAMVALVVGSILAGIGVIVQMFWQNIQPHLCTLFGPGSISDWLNAGDHALKFPFNGQYIAASIAGLSLLLYVVVSLLTCREPYDLDKLLHRGKYQVDSEKKVEIKKGFRLSRLAGVNENFSLGDRRLAYFTFFWGLTPNVCNLVVVIWNVGFGYWPWEWWWGWHYFWSVGIPIVGGVITTIWFTWGVSKDMYHLFKDLKVEKIDVTDDGQILKEEKPH